MSELSSLFEDRHQWQHRSHDFSASFVVAVDCTGLVERDMGFRCKIGTRGDPAAGTPGKKFKGLIIHATGQLEGWIRVGQQVQAANVSGAFFDGTEILRLTDDLQISLSHAHTGSAGVVVQDDRKISSLVDCQGVLCVFSFSRQSVRRRIDHQCVSPGRARSLRQDDRIFGTDGTGTDNQRQLA